MQFHVIIPARYDSTRLPGKTLVDIAGKPMIQHVYERALQSGAKQVVIATEHELVKAAAEKFGATVCMTSPQHNSGTERIAEAVTLLGLADNDIVVNVQGDEPLIPSRAIHQTAEALAMHAEADVGTLCAKITSYEALHNPSVAKVVRDKNHFALYFSRSPIPCDREAVLHGQTVLSPHMDYYRHIGLYAYHVRTIKQYIKWPESHLEQIEALEQLRFLWNGKKIYVVLAHESSPLEVNTAEDLEKVRKLLQQ